MLKKKDTSLVTLALLLALAALPETSATSWKMEAALAQSAAVPTFELPKQVKRGTKVRIDGSTSMATVNQALKKRFQKEYPGTSVNLSYRGTDVALQALLKGKIDLAAIGRPLTDKEKAQGLVAIPVTRNKIAIVVGQNNPFTGSLTDDRFAKIFRGEIKNWSEVGGRSSRIRFIDRPATSDTRQALRKYPVFQKKKFQTGDNAVQLKQDTTAAVVRRLGNDGISYTIAPQAVNQPRARIVRMHKVLPNDPRYPFSQQLFYVYKKSTPSPAILAFLGFATSNLGKGAIAEVGAADIGAIATPNSTKPIATAGKTATENRAKPLPVASKQAQDSSVKTSVQEASFWLWWLLPILLVLGLPIWWLWQNRPQSSINSRRGRERNLSPNPVSPTPSPATSNLPGNTISPPATTGISSQQRSIASNSISQTDSGNSETSNPFDIDAFTTGTVSSAPAPTPNLENGTAFAAGAGIAALSNLNNQGELPQEAGSSDVSTHTSAPTPTDTPNLEAGAAFAAGISASSDVGNQGQFPQETGNIDIAATTSAPTPTDTPNLEAGAAFAAGISASSDVGNQGQFPQETGNIDVAVTTSAPTPTDTPNIGDGAAFAAGISPLSDLGSETEFPQETGNFDVAATTSTPTPTDTQNIEAWAAFVTGISPLSDLGSEAEVPQETGNFDVAATTSASTPTDTPNLEAGAVFAAGISALPHLNGDEEHPQEVVEAAKFDVGQNQDFTAISLAAVDEGLPELPNAYEGESRIVLMPRDPQLAYAYWDIPSERMEELREHGGTKMVLRFYDVTDVDFDRQNPHSFQEYECNEMTRDWYLPVPLSDRNYILEIGYTNEDGGWLVLARSNSIHVPPLHPSEWERDRFITISWDQELQNKQHYGLDKPEKQPAGWQTNGINPFFGIAQSAATQNQPPVSSYIFPSGMGLWSLPTPSGIGMSGIGFSASLPPMRSRKFWLIADAEIIIYGATEPDATVTIGGCPIALNPDGTFRLQMSFQDGMLDYPILAVAADGEQSRSIHMNFLRETLARNTNSKEEAQEEIVDNPT